MKVSVLVMAASAVMLVACGTNPTKGVVENPLTKYLVKNGYRVSTMPSTFDSAGVLLEYDKNNKNPQAKGDLLSCAANDAARAEIDQVMFGATDSDRNRYKNASWPDFELKRDSKIELGLSAAVGAVGATTGYDRIRKARVTTSKAGPEKLFVLSVEGWLNNPENLSKLIDGCADAIASGRMHLVTESAYIEAGEIEFFGDDEFKVKLDKPAVLDAFKTAISIDPSIASKFTSEGTAKFDQRIYIAFKSAKVIPGVGTLGSGDKSEWDDSTALLQAAFPEE